MGVSQDHLRAQQHRSADEEAGADQGGDAADRDQRPSSRVHWCSFTGWGCGLGFGVERQDLAAGVPDQPGQRTQRRLVDGRPGHHGASRARQRCVRPEAGVDALRRSSVGAVRKPPFGSARSRSITLSAAGWCRTTRRQHHPGGVAAELR